MKEGAGPQQDSQKIYIGEKWKANPRPRRT